MNINADSREKCLVQSYIYGVTLFGEHGCDREHIVNRFEDNSSSRTVDIMTMEIRCRNGCIPRLNFNFD